MRSYIVDAVSYKLAFVYISLYGRYCNMVKEVRPDDPRILSPTFSIGIEVLGSDSGDDTDSSEDDIFYTPALTHVPLLLLP